jgi:3-keto-5-aminohexanoate cleavage enzyme
MTPCIISVAITGSVPKKKDTPAVPVTPEEQIASTIDAFKAGASLVHVHVRDHGEEPCSDPELFKVVQEGVRRSCPGMIIQFSTGARGRRLEERGGMLYLSPDMASLATGSVNFPTFVNENPPTFISDLARSMRAYDVKPECEVFDLAMLYNAIDLSKSDEITSPPHVQFVLGIKNALPARREILTFAVSELKSLCPAATWTAAGIGRSQLQVAQWALELGGHCRTGLEDNIRFDKSRLAASNAELVSLLVDNCSLYGRRPASAQEARRILGLPDVDLPADIV